LLAGETVAVPAIIGGAEQAGDDAPVRTPDDVEAEALPMDAVVESAEVVRASSMFFTFDSNERLNAQGADEAKSVGVLLDLTVT
jgi:hypothetical protein